MESYILRPFHSLSPALKTALRAIPVAALSTVSFLTLKVV
jgi:uncharacterized membrane protein